MERQVRDTPEAVAVAHNGSSITYRQLDEQAARVAQRLRAAGIRPDATVAVSVAPSLDLVVALLGVLKAGGAYVPIAPDAPPARMSHVITDVGAQAVLTETAVACRLSVLPCPVVLVDSSSLAEVRTPDLLLHSATADNLAYVIYTSGSTGAPKGVMISHRGIVNTLQWRQRSYPFVKSDRVLLTLSFIFDASVFEIFQPLMSGASVVVPDRELGGNPGRVIDEIRRHQITVLGGVPSILTAVAKHPDFGLCKSLRIVFSGGEPLTEDLVRTLKTRLDVDVVNVYGPTEASMEAASAVCAVGESVVVGRPIDNMRAYVLGDDLERVVVGSVGDLYLAGAGLARGYRGAPATTAARFLPDPFALSGGGRMYRTGDRCRERADGSLEFVGRDDRQVKVRGQRVELAEIERALQRDEGIAESAVVLLEVAGEDPALVAYVVPADPLRADPRMIRRHLADWLPRQLIPTDLVFVDALPRTATGKLDHRRCAALPRPPRASGGGCPPQSRLERLLETMWRRLLGVDVLSRDDDFFELGGTSIHAAALAHELEAELSEFVYSVALYDAPTIAELAVYLEANYPDATGRFRGTDAAVAATEGASDADLADLRRAVRTLPPRASIVNGPPNPSAVFVLSPPRCGSTLLRAMLGAHPSLFAPPELQLLNFNTLRERRAALSSDRDSFWLQGTVRALMELLHCDSATASAVMDDFEQGDVSVKDFYRFMQQHLDAATLVEKTPTYTLDRAVLDRAEEDFAQPRYVHLVRSPVAAISSFEDVKLHVFFKPFLAPSYRPSPSLLAEVIWTLSQQNILEFLATVAPDRQHLVRFEDLVRTPEPTLRAIAAFLGVPYDPRMADPYREDQRALMTDPIHPLGRMLGDVRYSGHGRIRSEMANRGPRSGATPVLGYATRRTARRLGYDFTSRPRALVTLQQSGDRRALFLVHPAAGGVSCYLPLTRELGDKQPLHALRSPALERGQPTARSVEQMAADYLAEVRTVQPTGPYQLAGWSFGGAVAVEMALQLASAGESVDLLAVLSGYLTRSDAAHPAVRWVDFVASLLQEHGADTTVLENGRLTGPQLLAMAHDCLKQVGAVPAGWDSARFRREMQRRSRLYRRHVQLASRYTPQSKLRELVLVEVADEVVTDHGRFADWSTTALSVTRHVVTGDHFTMLQHPHVSQVASLLRARMNAPAPAQA